MIGKRLEIEYSDDAGYAWFTTTEIYTGSEEKQVLRVPEGFSEVDLFAAVLSTGWVVDRDDELLMDRAVDCEKLSEFVEEMLFLLEAPGVLGMRLNSVTQGLKRFGFDEVDCVSPWQLAWLDLVVRDDAADLARTSDLIWGGDQLELDLRPIIEARLAQLRNRLATVVSTTPQLAGSERQLRNHVARRAN